MTGAGRPSPASTPNLVYYGGPVLSKITVFQVIWGSGTYLAGITNGGTATPTRLGDFYRAVTASSYLDWLCEYNTPTQMIGRGQFAGTITITPSPANDGATITDAEIEAELEAQFTAGTLPVPDANTVYMINFPLGKAITAPGAGTSCVDFCGYHSTGIRGGQYYYYAVLPDFSVGSNCDFGCGPEPALFDDLTAVASHEMVESITDPAVGQAPLNAPPLAWYDLVNGEIGDICDPGDSSIVGSDGITYIVQQEWSNARGLCIAGKANNPPVAQCQSASVTVFGCSAPASIDNGSHDPDCWDALQKSQSPPGPYPVGTTAVTLTVTDNAGAFSSCSANVTIVSSGCDDGSACTTGDTCTGSVCAGTPVPPPGEVDAGLLVTRSGGIATVTWNLPPGATSSDVLRGHVSGLPVGPGGGDESCLGDGISGTSFMDAVDPPLGDGFWYLVRGKNFCGEGSWGNEILSGQPPIPRITTSCP
jgi:hypothetical protein